MPRKDPQCGCRFAGSGAVSGHGPAAPAAHCPPRQAGGSGPDPAPSARPGQQRLRGGAAQARSGAWSGCHRTAPRPTDPSGARGFNPGVRSLVQPPEGARPASGVPALPPALPVTTAALLHKTATCAGIKLLRS